MLLMRSLQRMGIETVDGGGGGSFFRSALYRWKIDTLHLHWLHPYIIRGSWIASAFRGLRLIIELAILRAFGKRLVWTVHNMVNHEGMFPGIEVWVSRWVARLSHAIVCHSEYAAELAAKIYSADPSRIVVAPHPAWSIYDDTVTRAEARSDLGLGECGRVFAFVGRVAPYKGVDELISAFGKIESDSARLVVAGGPVSDSYRMQIECLAAVDDRIHTFLKFVPDDQMQLFLKAADVVVFPFRDILTSGSVLLAMEFGRPCIAPMAGAIPETLPSEQFPLLYEPSDKGGLFEAMMKAMRNDDDLCAIGNANSRQVRDWTWDSLAATCASLYEPPRKSAA